MGFSSARCGTIALSRRSARRGAIRWSALCYLMESSDAGATSPREPDIGSTASREDRERAANILGGRAIRRAAKGLRKIVVAGLAIWQPEEGRFRAQVQQRAWPSHRAAEQQVSDAVQSVQAHLEGATNARHPVTVEGRTIHPDAMAAVRHLVGLESSWASWADREHRVKIIRKWRSSLEATERQLDSCRPPHIRAMPTRVHAALLEACCQAAGVPDSNLALDFVCGFQAVGDIPASGWWPAQPRGERGEITELDNAAWNRELTEEIRRAAQRPGTRDDLAAVLRKTRDEEAAQHVNGPFTLEEVEAAAGGPQRLRLMHRFAVWQKGAVRACDNARLSLHNWCSSVGEHMQCETADFPARAAAAFADATGAPQEMKGGTDDVGSFYRVVPTDDPRWTAFALWNPDLGRVEYYTLPGFNFGLSGAPPQCNRVSSALERVARALLAAVTGKFYDDFALAEWARSADSGQWALRELAKLLDMPFAAKKAVDVASIMVFLGVETNFGVGASPVVRVSVTKERKGRLARAIEDARVEGLRPAEARSLCGKLQFTLAWAFCRFGRAAMQPLFVCSERSGDADDAELAAEREALDFFAALVDGLVPYDFLVLPTGERPVLVWSDGACEPGTARPHTVGFVVASPRDDAPAAGEGASGLRALAEYYVTEHGSAELDVELISALKPRKQQIGQVELVGLLAPYLSLPHRFRGRKVLHWVDNSSAAAAASKGYSRQADSARIVHILHTTLASLGARVWFEYVRTKANVADEPSRVDLGQLVYDIGAEFAAEVSVVLRSAPVDTVLPEVDAWSRRLGSWLMPHAVIHG